MLELIRLTAEKEKDLNHFLAEYHRAGAEHNQETLDEILALYKKDLEVLSRMPPGDPARRMYGANAAMYATLASMLTRKLATRLSQVSLVLSKYKGDEKFPAEVGNLFGLTHRKIDDDRWLFMLEDDTDLKQLLEYLEGDGRVIGYASNELAYIRTR